MIRPMCDRLVKRNFMKSIFFVCSVLFTLISNVSWAFGCFSTPKEPEAIVTEQVALVTGDIFTLEDQTTTGMDPVHVAYSHSGSFLSVANGTINGSISVYKVKKDRLGFIQEIGAGINPNYLSYAPNDNFLAVVNTNMQTNGRGSIIVYQADCKVGTLSRLQTLQAPANPEILNPFAVTYSPDGRFAAVSNQDFINDNSSILVYRVHPVSGKWQLVQIIPLTVLTVFPFPWELQYSPDGRFLSVVLNSPSSVRTFDVDPVTGELTNPQNTTADLVNPTGIAYSHSGQFAAVTNFNATIVTYQVNSATGALVPNGLPLTTSTPGLHPWFVAYSSDDLVAAVTNRFSAVVPGPGTVTVYCVDQETGEFSPSPVQTIPNLQDPVGIDFAPCSPFAAVTERTANRVDLYKVENDICIQ